MFHVRYRVIDKVAGGLQREYGHHSYERWPDIRTVAYATIKFVMTNPCPWDIVDQRARPRPHSG